MNPYALQIKIGLIILAMAGLFGTGIWLRGVFAERATLRASEAQAKATTKMYADVWNHNEQLKKGIVDAVKSIRVQSNNYITSVENAPPPAVFDGGTVVLVAPGVPEALPGVPGSASNPSSGTGTAATRN